MASPGQLVDAVAEVLGVPQPTVKVHDYNLSVAGLRSKGGRGRSAAKMTSVDAANLLIAVAASSFVKDTVDTVRDYADLPLFQDMSASWTGTLPSLESLGPNHTVREVLVGLIDAARTGDLINWITKVTPVDGQPPIRVPYTFRLRIVFHGPRPMVDVRLPTRDLGADIFMRYVEPTPETDDLEVLKQWSAELQARDRSGDLEQLRIFTATTILRIGKVLNT